MTWDPMPVKVAIHDAVSKICEAHRTHTHGVVIYTDESGIYGCVKSWSTCSETIARRMSHAISDHLPEIMRQTKTDIIWSTELPTDAAGDPDFDAIADMVMSRVEMLETALDTQSDDAGRERVRRELIGPAMDLLAQFCELVRLGGDAEGDET